MNSRDLQVSGWASVSCWAMPLSSMPMPRVMMKGSVRWCTMRNPFTAPISAPAAMAAAKASQMGSPALTVITARMPPMHRVPPTDRSHPPHSTATDTPMATISSTAAERSMSSQLYRV